MSGKLGIHSLVFSDQWDASNASAACRAASEIGYDLIEVLMFDPAALDIPLTRRVTRETGLGLRLGMALGPDADISSSDPVLARRGEETVARALEIAAELGAPAVSGITYAAFSNYGAPATNDARARVAESLSRLDRHAGALGVRLGLEPVNRYESYLANTLDEAASLIRASGGSNLFIHMDTFHMNIEEGDVAAAIHRNAALLGYAHVADSNRGVLGGGHFDLSGYFRTLESAGYTGDFTVEAFSSRVLSDALVGGVRLWREAWEDSIVAARSAYDVLCVMRKNAKAGCRVW
ncbi:sugar phosphate isomerase/epimerase [Sinorhizobium sp. NFACC03]|uniref:sugar phosphate isomerase/epimerase family protein n=1 Tax=Sinorhizobium sp. NFACC03 TaxID=1566295 RepID=UPI00088332E0|nr:sugar phosphate isomerase/epimerase [Sinorhizobium sp. NFACC03]SDA61816.1 D-psicose/D-tagatose/L-ribulose 3-epimerase [Sinorhizobium sp. NFACC03]